MANSISEDMVKLIFNPIKEALSSTTTAINEASSQVRELARLYSTPPVRGDIITQILGSLKEHDKLSEDRLKSQTDGFEKTIEDHQEDVEHLLEKFELNFEKVLEQISHIKAGNKAIEEQENTTQLYIQHLSTALTDNVSKLNDKVERMMWVVGIAFGLSLIVAGVIIYFTTKTPDSPKSEPSKSSKSEIKYNTMFATLEPSLQMVILNAQKKELS